jgi:excisionase family DNA binding protein
MSRSETEIAPTQRPLLATPREAARVLNVSRETIYRMTAAGQLQSVRVRGSLRIPLSALQRFCLDDLDNDEPNAA